MSDNNWLARLGLGGRPKRGRSNGAHPEESESAPFVADDGSEGWLTASGVRKSYRRRLVVRGVDLAVCRGEVVGLLGPNGAGKTTVFYMITGLVPADAGPHHDRRARRDAAADVPAGPPWHRLSAAGSLDLSRSDRRAEHHGDPGAGRAEPEASARTTRRACSRSSTSRACARAPRSRSRAVSGGAARLRGRSLRGRRICLLDEPFAGIDPIAVGDIQQLVRHLNRRGLGVLITDHNVRETLSLVDRAYVIAEGQVLTQGSPSEIIANEDVRRVYLGDMFG